MKAETFLQNTLLGLDCVKLGRLVLNARNPQQDYHDHPNAPIQISVNPQRNFQEIINLSKHSKVRSHLMTLLSISYKNQKGRCVTLKAYEAKTYQLMNSGTWFKDACLDGTTRTWLDDAIRHSKDVYLVVGFHTVIDAEVTQEKYNGGSSGGSAELQSTMAVPDAVAVSLGASFTRNIQNQSSMSFNAPGEQIYAIQYRKLVFKWYLRRSIDTASLESHCKSMRRADFRRASISQEPTMGISYTQETMYECGSSLRLEASREIPVWWGASEKDEWVREVKERMVKFKEELGMEKKRHEKECKAELKQAHERWEEQENERVERNRVEMEMQHAIDELAVEYEDDTEEFIF